MLTLRMQRLLQVSALLGFASTALAETRPDERDVVRCTTTQDCQGAGVYLPPNSVAACSPRRICTFACNSGFVAVNGVCQQICQTDADCTIGATSWNSHLSCISGSCGWACNDGYLSTGGGCLATATRTQATSSQTTRAASSSTTSATSTSQPLRTAIGSPLAATVGPSATQRASGAFAFGQDRTILGVPTPSTTSALPTGTQCVQNSDCDNSIPADSHNSCILGICGWGCNSGYAVGFGGAGCEPVITTPLAAPTAPAAVPSLIRTYAGSSFFDRWFFYNDTDPTQGMVNYVPRNYANKAGLTYITPSGTAVLQVDRTSTLPPGAYRDSVRIMSLDTYDAGTLIIIDMKHVPYGCSTWPAFWTFNWPWPNYGEIDVYEGVNNRFFNQMTLHTEAGCTRSGAQTGNVQWASPNCYAYSGGDNGCTVFDYDPSSYGAGFNAAGGGVFALQIAETGVSIWRWTRSQIPGDVQSGNPRPYTWGTPSAAWDGATCDTRTYIKEQMLTFDITTCGSWAGIDGVFQSSDLSGACYPKYANCAAAMQDPAAFAEAYFEVNYIGVFQV
ncbi:hypothetical protein JCM10908_000272 [Rhodotorula pacifica]|uniref:glycoside hydrolase family 16 protein n=1 Tax=Rhodotorula pacifica TaxID=1495444 RepID=UPI00317114CF